MAQLSISSCVTSSLQLVEKDATYIALPGSQDHGPSCIQRAIARGATTIIIERGDHLCRALSVENMVIGVRYVLVPSAGQVLAQHSQPHHAVDAA